MWVRVLQRQPSKQKENTVVLVYLLVFLGDQAIIDYNGFTLSVISSDLKSTPYRYFYLIDKEKLYL